MKGEIQKWIEQVIFNEDSTDRVRLSNIYTHLERRGILKSVLNIVAKSEMAHRLNIMKEILLQEYIENMFCSVQESL